MRVRGGQIIVMGISLGVWTHSNPESAPITIKKQTGSNMVKKTLLSLAIAATTAGLAGCNISSVETHNDNVDTTPVTSGTVGNGGQATEITRVIYNPSSTNAAGLPNIPLITDLLIQGLAGADSDCASEDTATCLDGTIPFPGGDIALGGAGYNPIFSAVGDLDGFSTVSAIDVAFDGALDATSIVTTPGALTNVLLVPLNYTNDPIAGGKPLNNDAPALNAANPFGAPVSIEASVITYSDSADDANNVLRIMPKEPLKSKTRYLVVVTDGLKDAEGVGVRSSTTFSLLAIATADAQDPTAAKLQGAIRSWVGLAKGITGGLGQQLETSDIAYTTTFTTGGGTEILSGMAAPGLVNAAVNQTMPADLRYVIESNLVSSNGDVTAAAAGFIGYVNALPEPNKTGIITALGGAEAWQANAGAAVALAAALPQPAPRVADFTVKEVPLTTLGITGTNLNISNGSINLPYYLSAPDTTSLATLSTTALRSFAGFWQADDTLGTDLSALLSAVNIPASAVTPPSSNVTRLFPLAKTGLHTSETNPLGYVDVPVSVFYSSTEDCSASGYDPVIYQHGITTKRTAAIPFAAQVVAADACTAVVAIDLPMHGLDPTDATEKNLLGGLYTALADMNGDSVTNSTDDLIYGLLQQRHFGLTQSATGTPRSMLVATPGTDGDVSPADGIYDDSGSGSLFINIANFQNTRDNMRQAVMDLLNLNASLKYLNFSDSAVVGADINTNASVKFAGHSLGSIVGTPFLALSNALNGSSNIYLNNVEAGVLANGSGHVTKMIENSFAFGPTIVDGFEALGNQASTPLDLSQGSSLFELTMHIFQATIDSADPMNFAGMLNASAAGSGVLMFEIVGDGASNAPDLVVPPAAFADNGTPPRVLLDNVLQGEDGSNDKLADTSAAPLAGATPLASAAGFTAATQSEGDGSQYLRRKVSFTAGDHSSFGELDDATGTEMIGQVNEFFDNDGKVLTMTNTAIVKQ